MHPYDNSHNAPEVVRHPSDLIHVPNEMESPEVLRQTYFDSPQHHKATSSESNGFFPEKESSPLHSTLPAGEASFGRATSSWRRKRLVWILVAVVVASAVGLGAGLGIGLGTESKNETVPKSDTAVAGSSSSSSYSTTTSTTPSSTTATASATEPAVTSGSTGVAQFSCSGGETTHSSDGTEYVQECYTMYPAAGRSYYSNADNNVTMKNLGGKNTVYSFESCLDHCDNWNANGNLPACRAVSYYANLTAPINLWGGNCFLKNDRGLGSNGDPVDWHHTASAYRSCLNVTCSGST